jgi:Ca2+-transporting ATPase
MILYERKTTEEVFSSLKTGKNGLSDAEAKKRLAENGHNALAEKKQKTMFQMFLAQLNEPMIYILMAAAVISVFLGEVSDAVIILVVILINAVIGVVQEGRAQKALDALKKMSSPTAMVVRGGTPVEIPAEELVVGDLVRLEAGRIVPADLRLSESINMKIDESALTGESVPSDKDAAFVADGDLPIGDKANMAFMSTPVAYGRGEGVIVATGMNTEIGKIAGMLNEQGDEITPLQARLADLGKLLGIATLVICGLLFGIALIQKRDIAEMLITAISLAVAAVPEGLPAVVTIVLAIGVQQMVRVHAIVRRLPAVETLGAVSVVCSDKTGTLTQNKMTVTSVYLNGQTLHANKLTPENANVLLNGFVLCNDASIEGGSRIGDPTEIALLDIGAHYKLSRSNLEKELPRIDELSFDSTRKMMTTVHKYGAECFSYQKARWIIFFPAVRSCSKTGL